MVVNRERLNGIDDIVGQSKEQPTIVLVDDNRVIQRMIAQALQNHGYHVLQASDGVEGLQKAMYLHETGHTNYGVISDTHMRDMHGPSLAREIKVSGLFNKYRPLFVAITGDHYDGTDQGFIRAMREKHPELPPVEDLHGLYRAVGAYRLLPKFCSETGVLPYIQKGLLAEDLQQHNLYK